MPLYEGLPDKRIYKTRLAAYFNFINGSRARILALRRLPKHSMKNCPKSGGIGLVCRNLAAVCAQFAKHHYGSDGPRGFGCTWMCRPMLFLARATCWYLKGQVKERIDTTLVGPIETHVVKAPHRITPGAAEFIAQRIPRSLWISTCILCGVSAGNRKCEAS